MRITLCFLVWNERIGCEMDIPKIDLDVFDEVYAVDGGSTDGTIEYFKSQNITVYPQTRKGYNAAYKFAFEQCSTDALIFFHPKGTVPVQHIYLFKPYLEQGFDLVVGSRLASHSSNEEDDKFFRYRKWFVLIIAKFCSVLWKKEGNTCWDVLHGFRAMKKEAFQSVDILEEGLSADLEMVVRSYKTGLKIIEFPTHETNCTYRDTHFKALPTGAKILKYIGAELFRKDKKVGY